ERRGSPPGESPRIRGLAEIEYYCCKPRGALAVPPRPLKYNARSEIGFPVHRRGQSFSSPRRAPPLSSAPPASRVELAHPADPQSAKFACSLCASPGAGRVRIEENHNALQFRRSLWYGVEASSPF